MFVVVCLYFIVRQLQNYKVIFAFDYTGSSLSIIRSFESYHGANVVISGSTKCCIIEDWWRIYGRVMPTRHLTHWAWWRIYVRDDTNPSFNPLRPGDAPMMDLIPTRHLTHWGLMMRMVGMIPTRHLTQWGLVTHIAGIMPTCQLTHWGLVTHFWCVWYQLVVWSIEAWSRIYGRDDI